MSGDQYRAGEFVWLRKLYGDELAIFVQTKEGNIATILVCGDTANRAIEMDASLGNISPATTNEFKKKHVREAISLISDYSVRCTKAIMEKLNINPWSVA